MHLVWWVWWGAGPPAPSFFPPFPLHLATYKCVWSGRGGLAHEFALVQATGCRSGPPWRLWEQLCFVLGPWCGWLWWWGGCSNLSDGVSVSLLSLVGIVALLQVYSGDSLEGSLLVSCILVLTDLPDFCARGPHLTRGCLGALMGVWVLSKALAVCVLLGAVHRCVLIGLAQKGAAVVVIRVPILERSTWWWRSPPSFFWFSSKCSITFAHS